MRIVPLLAVSLMSISCKDTTPIPVAFSSTQLGTTVTATLTTTPGPLVRLVVKPERGTVGHPGRAEEMRYSGEDGTAVFQLDGPEGENAINVTATNDKGQRKTELRFKFAVTPPVVPEKPEVIEITDATADREGQTLVGCHGVFDETTAERIDICRSPVRLGTDNTIGFTIKASKGKKVTLGDKSFEFKDGVAEARIDLMPIAMALESLSGERPISVPMTLELPEGTKKTDLALGADVAWEFFKKAGKGPLLFPGEKPRPGGKASMVVPAYGSVFGDYPTVADIDLVAQLTSITRTASPCTYEAGSAGEKRTLARSGEDLTAIVYDRRTGKQVAKKAFSAPVPSCPKYVMANDSDSRNGSIDEYTVNLWLETLVTKPAEP